MATMKHFNGLARPAGSTQAGFDGRFARPAAAAMVALVLLGTLSGCGAGAFRDRQDWSGVEDARLYRACHVTNFGSGVVLGCAGGDAYVLTCAHLVAEGASVGVYVPRPDGSGYQRFSGRVLVRSHPHKEDLALLQLDGKPEGIPADAKISLAQPLLDGEQTDVTVLSVSFGAEDRPAAADAKYLAHVATVSSIVPDKQGRTKWQLSKGLVHGGVRQANSGSPVFAGDALVGLCESSPAFANAPGGKQVLTGVMASRPGEILGFLGRHGYLHLVRADKATPDRPATAPAEADEASEAVEQVQPDLATQPAEVDE